MTSLSRCQVDTSDSITEPSGSRRVKQEYVMADIEIWRDIPIAELHGYQASNLGRIRRRDTGELASQWVGDRRYLYTTVYVPDRTQYRSHRLICAAFKPVPDPTGVTLSYDTKDGIPWHVNHIDHDITNNRPENLEWCTPGDNVNWAADNDRIATSIKVSVEDTIDGTSVTYRSMKEAGRALDVSVKRISQCAHRQNELLHDRYRIRILDTDRLGKAITTNSVDVLCCDYRAGPADPKLMRIATIAHASRMTGVTERTIANRLDGSDVLTNGYVFRRLSDIRPWPEYSDQQVRESCELHERSQVEDVSICSGKPVDVLDVSNGTIERYLTLRHATRALGSSYSVVVKGMHHDDGPHRAVDGHVYKWIDDPMDIRQWVKYTPKVAYWMRNYVTGDVVHHPDAASIRAKFGVTPDKIFTRFKVAALYQDCYMVVDVDTEPQWPEFTQADIDKSRAYTAITSYLVKDYQTGEVIQCASAADVRAILVHPPGDLFKYQDHPKFPPRLIKGRYRLKISTDTSDWLEF